MQENRGLLRYHIRIYFYLSFNKVYLLLSKLILLHKRSFLFKNV